MDEPKYETNWCDLPPDFKLQCIQKMPFVTRLKFRCTASEERNLVDSTKCHLEYVRIRYNEIHVAESGEKRLITDIGMYYPNEGIETHMMQFLDYIFKVGIIDHLNILDKKKKTIIEKMAPMMETRVLHVKNFTFTYLNNKDTQFLLSRCDERKLEVVELTEYVGQIDIHEVLENPIVNENLTDLN